MKIGFLDSVSNVRDVFPIAAKLATERIAGLDLTRYTAPGILKIPASAKKLFEQGCDAVLVLVIADEQAVDELSLVHEKTIDIEMQYGRFVFYCIMLKGEWEKESDLDQLAQTRISQCLELITKTGGSSGPSSSIGSQEVGDAFAAMSLAALAGVGESKPQAEDLTEGAPGQSTENPGDSESIHTLF